MFPLPVATILLITMILFGFTAIRWILILRKGQADARFDHLFRRLKNVLTIALAQTRMIRGDFKAGLMHAVIFWGFLVVALRTILLFGFGFDPDFGAWFLGTFPGHLYTLILTLNCWSCLRWDMPFIVV